MRIGLHAVGIGAGADPAVLAAVAVEAERAGFATLWSGEHVVMVEQPSSRYPYAADGQLAIPPDTDWLDPSVTLSFAAAVTSSIRLATGVLLLPEHHPVVVAKQAASIDKISCGRFTLGVGVGWSREEFDALGIPFERRDQRAAQYVAAMRTIWAEDVAAFNSEFVTFPPVRVYPKPARRRIPVVVGGNSGPALRRVADWGDGWYGFGLPDVEQVADCITTMRGHCGTRRDWRLLDIAVALQDPQPADLRALAELGVDELVLVETPPGDPGSVSAWIAALAAMWVHPARAASP